MRTTRAANNGLSPRFSIPNRFPENFRVQAVIIAELKFRDVQQCDKCELKKTIPMPIESGPIWDIMAGMTIYKCEYGQKQDDAGRAERIADGIEKNFDQCNVMLNHAISAARARGGFGDRDFRDFEMFLKTSARLANVAARFETIKNRGSNTK